jgi:hypothetical protein
MSDEKPIKTNYPGNSHKSVNNPEKKAVEKVITGTAVTRPKGLGSKIAEAFIMDDTKTVGQYILFDVVIPTTKNLIMDMGNEFLSRLLNGTGGSRIRRDAFGRSTGGSVGYNKMYSGSSGRGDDRERPMSNRARATHDFDEIEIETRGEAEDVLATMGDRLDQYGMVTLTDLYDMVGISGSFADDKWGWVDLRGSEVVRNRAGRYVLSLPKPKPMD